MRFPARFVTENLIWSIDGPVWALWRLDPVSYPYLSTAEKIRLFHRIRGALMVLPSDSMILSVCREIDPWAVAERMLWGIDPEQWPAWRDHVTRTLDRLEDQLIYDRYHYLAVALPDGDNRRFAGSAAAASSWFGSLLGLTPTPPTRADLDRRRRQAAQLESQLANGLSLRPAAPAEVRWLYARAPLRGLVEPPLDESWTPDVVEAGNGPEADLLGPSLVHLVDAVVQEGGDASDADRPRRRRYVRVETEIGVSYQTFLVMAGMPQSWRFPNGGGEWFVAADQAPFPVDWCARITSIANSDAQAKSRRQARQLQAQLDEYEGEPAGPPASLQAAMDSVDAERRELSSSPSTPELRVTMIFGLASADLTDLELQAAQMRAAFEAWEYELPRPTGGQVAMFRAMLPGSTSPTVARDYAQFLLPSGLAAGVPIAGTRVGDPSGTLLGRSLDGGTNQPVLFDAGYGMRINRSASLAAVGGLGAGKSHAIKLIAHAEIARGNRVVVLDRTVSGEYVRFASAVPGQVQVVKLSQEAETCLDPLAVFTGTDRVRYAGGFLTLLCGADPTDLAGATLAEAVRTVAARPDGRLRQVITELERMSQQGAARSDRTGQIARQAEQLSWKLTTFAEGDLARLAFGEGPAVDLYADFIVLWTPGLRLPDREQLTNEYLARRMSPEQVFSQAMLYLMAAIARHVAFSDPSTFAAALFDEAWSLTSSPQGKALLLEGIRDGRKHNAAIWLLSQHPDDIDPQLAELLGNRLVFRQARGAAEKSLRFLGLDPTAEWVELLETGLAPGQCLYRDVRDRVGRIQVDEAMTADLARAVDTNPASGLELLDDEYRSTTRRSTTGHGVGEVPTR